MSQKQSPTKMSEIADLAGVSIATVSRVLHKTNTVSEEARKQVEDAIQTLGYRVRRRPKQSIPKVATEKIVLLFTTDIVNPFFAEVIRGTQEEIELQDHSEHALSIMHLSNDHEGLIQAARQMSALGIILTGAYPFPELIKFQQASKIPLIVINYRITGPRISCIIVDFKDAYFRATRHLIDLGHRRIGFVDDTGHSEIGVARLEGYQDALSEAGLPGQGPWVGLSPGAAYGLAKRWEPARFAALGRELVREFGARLVLLGADDERPVADEVREQIQGPVVDLVGRTSLRQALGIMSQLNLLVTNDSGLMHAAAALSVPLVALFGSTDPVATGPFTSRATVIHHLQPCSPCLKRTCETGYTCLTAISVNEVAAAARAWLKEGS